MSTSVCVSDVGTNTATCSPNVFAGGRDVLRFEHLCNARYVAISPIVAEPTPTSIPIQQQATPSSVYPFYRKRHQQKHPCLPLPWSSTAWSLAMIPATSFQSKLPPASPLEPLRKRSRMRRSLHLIMSPLTPSFSGKFPYPSTEISRGRSTTLNFPTKNRYRP